MRTETPCGGTAALALTWTLRSPLQPPHGHLHHTFGRAHSVHALKARCATPALGLPAERPGRRESLVGTARENDEETANAVMAGFSTFPEFIRKMCFRKISHAFDDSNME